MTTTPEADLAEFESLIEPDPTAFATVGLALAHIRDQHLYPQPRFADYCSTRWGLHGKRGDQFIVSARAVADMAELGLPVPGNEYAARILACVPAEIRATVWTRALELGRGHADSGTITAARTAIEGEIEAAEASRNTTTPKGVRRSPQRTQADALASGIQALTGLCAGLDGIDEIDPAVTKEEAAQWVRDLSDSLRVLRSLTTKLKEHAPW